MFTLFHHPFCPHSRFIRLALGEHGFDLRLVEERAWERREAFLVLNPAGTTPVLIDESRPAIPGAGIIAEYLDETHGGAAKANVRYHLAYIGWLAQTRNFLAGDQLTYADLAAAAHLSAIDYLGDVPWIEDEAAKAWYARVKSRPSFRPLLSEWLAGVPASRTYVDLDF